MKKGMTFLFLLAILGSTYYGLKSHFGRLSHLPRQVEQSQIQKTLGKVHPILEDKKFVALVVAENNRLEVERNLTSLFEQTYPHLRIVYVDNGSTDGTLKKVKELIAEKKEKIEIIRNDTRKNHLEVLYEVIGRCASNEVVALVRGKDWLSHENVFDHLNCAYANPDVWMTYSRAISHPEYSQVIGKNFSDATFIEKKFRKVERSTLTPLVTFYAGFFQQIKLQDCLYDGTFIDEKISLAVQLPLLEMGPEHIFMMDEVSYVINESNSRVDHQLHLQKVAAIESHLRSLSHYPTLSRLNRSPSHPSFHRYKTDLILFSEDRPLHLYACLESLLLKGRDINEVYVLYKGSDQEFQRAYLNLQNEFHTVQFLNVCDYPGNDYASLIQKVLENKRHASPYVVIGNDQFIFEERVWFHDCISALEKVHGDHFFLSFETKEEDPLPPTIAIADGIYAYQLGEVGASHPFTLALCRKSLFENLIAVTDIASFKTLWQDKLTPSAVALFYEEKKTLPLKAHQEHSLTQKREWGHKFIEGFKIDLPSLSYEVDKLELGELPLIKREKRRPKPEMD